MFESSTKTSRQRNMAKQETGVAKPEEVSKFMELAKKLNTSVQTVLTNNALMGFEKAFQLAAATKELKSLLTDDYMMPIMELQGSKLGFKTDKDAEGGYKLPVVRNCLIEAVLFGVQPFGNQFNIIAGNCYLTKEGFGYLLKKETKIKKFSIIPALPRIKTNDDGTQSAAIVMKTKWTPADGSGELVEDLEIPIKVNKFMGTDAVIGKATRKARAWLYNTINGSEIPEGDAFDTTAEVVETKINTKEEKSNSVQEGVGNLFGENKNEPKQ